MPPYSNPYSQTVPNPASTNNFVWVHGVEGAYRYPIPVNSSMLLMDADNDGVFYIKSTDVSGMPLPLRTFSYKEIIEEPKSASNFVSKEDFNALLERVDKMAKIYDELTEVKG